MDRSVEEPDPQLEGFDQFELHLQIAGFLEQEYAPRRFAGLGKGPER